MTDYEREIEAWRARRLTRLTSADGWLALTGLFWLEPGRNAVGSAGTSRVLLPADRAPGVVGDLEVSESGTEATLHVGPGVAVTADGQPVARAAAVRSDAQHPATRIRIGSVEIQVIRRDGRLAARVWDAEGAARHRFAGIPFFPVDPAWRIEARFEPAVPPRRLPVTSILGFAAEEICPGDVVFQAAGQTHRLASILERGETDYWVVFADATSGRETYGACRFVYVPPPVAGRTVIDFNKAYNPPCAFTPYSTCPLPPVGNRLPFRVEAGERLPTPPDSP